jgi:hypothetical protein
MSYFPDLSPYSYLHDPEVNGIALNIGWLDKGKPYAKGTVPPDVISKLAKLCETPDAKTRGYHTCPFCFNLFSGANSGVLAEVNGKQFRLGSAEIRVRSGGKIYAAPNMILHYIKDHNYLPPLEFIKALQSNADGG